jgi:predicted aconitase with swiveling domain
METIEVKVHSITGGFIEGEVLVTDEAFNFMRLDALTGKCVDKGHEWYGRTISKKIIAFPYGKGSGFAGMYILKAAKHGNLPAAVINTGTDPVIGAGLILAELIYDIKIPVVEMPGCKLSEIIKTNDYVKVDAQNGVLEITRA